MNERAWMMGFLLLPACAPLAPAVRSVESSLDAAPLLITEVAQATSYDGSTADKVEVYCANASGCSTFKVCDTAASGASCSALQSALSYGQRAVVSRGTSITSADQVWLADGAGTELANTRVGPFACASGSAQTRDDCASASFTSCGVPNLGASTGSCPSGFAYDLKFTTNQHGGPESTCNRPLCQALVAAISAAQASVDFAIYGIRNQPDIIAALVSAQQRGVVVRGVVDSENASCTAFGYADTPLLMSSLAPGSVVCDSGPGYSYIMHDKFFVFDGQKVWMGSTNTSDTETGGEYNSDVAALISSVDLAQIYLDEFEEMFAGQCHRRKTDNTQHVLDGSYFGDGTTVVKSYFSPTDRATSNAVLPLIEGASHTLDIAMFFFTHQTIADAILAAKARGVVVRMILDAGGAGNSASKHGQLCNAGIAVKVENWGGKSHSKWAVADAAYPDSAAVVFGSMNWTSAGDTQNDENTLYVKNAGFASEFAAEFARQWTDLSTVPSCVTLDAESADSSSCTPADNCAAHCSSGACCDGLDNDYDGQVDMAEEACACGDGVDNDGDGYVDAADYDCQNLSDP